MLQHCCEVGAISYHLPAILFPSSCRLQSAARLWRRWVGFAVMAPSSMDMSGALTDYGHFDNLAFFKSPLQSAVNYFPSQFITSCLIWTCLAYPNCNCLFLVCVCVCVVIIPLPQLYHWKMNHPQTSRGQTWSAVESSQALNQFLLDTFFFATTNTQ